MVDDEVEALEDAHLISQLAEFNDKTTTTPEPADRFVISLQEATMAADPDLDADTVAQALEDITKAGTSWKPSTRSLPSLKEYPSHGNDEEDTPRESFVADLEECGVPRHSIVRSSGQLCTPVQIQFYFRCKGDQSDLISAIDQRRSLLRLYVSNSGLER